MLCHPHNLFLETCQKLRSFISICELQSIRTKGHFLKNFSLFQLFIDFLLLVNGIRSISVLVCTCLIFLSPFSLLYLAILLFLTLELATTDSYLLSYSHEALSTFKELRVFLRTAGFLGTAGFYSQFSSLFISCSVLL